MYTYCIAEDEYYVQKSIEGRLKALDLGLTGAGAAFTGTDALELYKKQKPDLFFVDIHMPQGNGLELIERIRKEDPGCGTLFIIISGYSDYAHMKRAIHAEVFDYLQKPISPPEFLGMMQRAVAELNRRKTDAGSGSAVNSEEKTSVSLNDTEVFEKSESTDLCDRICGYLQSHYMDDINIKTLSDRFYLSASHISHIFKNKMGVTPGKYLEDIRLKQAEQLIRNTDLLISDIAELTGYSDGNYFAKCFRKKYQISPSDIRKKRDNEQ